MNEFIRTKGRMNALKEQAIQAEKAKCDAELAEK